MWIPSRAGFARAFAMAPPRGYYFSQKMHPNPAFYKYTWQIWTPDTELEGKAFLAHAPKLGTAQHMRLRAELIAAGRHFFVYNAAQPRLGAAPFDRSHPRWAGVQFAPALDNDMDPAWNGHR
ncbi:hypothetical protein [Cupriavidus sp. SK-3]|uniref:hypothetical protein n=1 Tax=Cupriavidus sp. SK-3 TaxID=1470558 RepID=UPI00056D1331|nr:hypothetical protein [Cupriavidus sp. SK-3]